MQMVIGAPPVSSLPVARLALIFKVRGRVRLTTEETAASSASEFLREANLIKGLTSLLAAFQTKLLG